jgi:hypothetical protein
MRKVICLAAILALCVSLMCPAFAAEDTFVPSIGYKDGPGIIEVEEGYDIKHLVVTSIKGAKEKTTDIYQEDRDLLLSVYQQLADGSMKLPLEGTGSMARTGGLTKKYYVIRELVDVSFTTACRESDDGHKQKLAEDGVTISLKFHLGVDASTEVLVLTYIDGQWDFIESVTNNGDGTLTCVFEDICPVAFVVRGQTGGSQTGDPAGQRLILWVCLMVASAGALTVMFVKRRKNTR